MNSASQNQTNKTPFSSFSGRWLLAFTLCGLLFAGCKNPGWTIPGTTIGGAGLGAIVGGIFGGSKGAAIGAAVGGGLGFIAGTIIYDKQKDLETRKKVLDASIADATKVLSEHRAYNDYLEAQIQKVKDALKRINDAQANGQITADKARQMRQELVPGIDSMSSEAKQTAETFKEFGKKLETAPQANKTAEEYAKELKIGQELKQEEARLTQIFEALAAQRNAAAQ